MKISDEYERQSSRFRLSGEDDATGRMIKKHSSTEAEVSAAEGELQLNEKDLKEVLDMCSQTIAAVIADAVDASVYAQVAGEYLSPVDFDLRLCWIAGKPPPAPAEDTTDSVVARDTTDSVMENVAENAADNPQEAQLNDADNQQETHPVSFDAAGDPRWPPLASLASFTGAHSSVSDSGGKLARGWAERLDANGGAQWIKRERGGVAGREGGGEGGRDGESFIQLGGRSLHSISTEKPTIVLEGAHALASNARGTRDPRAIQALMNLCWHVYAPHRIAALACMAEV